MSGWIKCSDRLPDTPSDSDTTFIVAVKRAHNGKTYVFSAEWLNQKLLCTPDVDEPEDGLPYTGWHSIEAHADYEQYWEPLITPGTGDEVTHWQPLPAPPTE